MGISYSGVGGNLLVPLCNYFKTCSPLNESRPSEMDWRERTAGRESMEVSLARCGSENNSFGLTNCNLGYGPRMAQ